MGLIQKAVASSWVAIWKGCFLIQIEKAENRLNLQRKKACALQSGNGVKSIQNGRLKEE